MPKEDSTDQEQGSNQATLSGASTSRSAESRRSVGIDASRTDSDGHASASSDLRYRTSTTRQMHQHSQRQPYSTGRDLNGKPIFTLAGPSVQDDQNNERGVHQAFVEPGYTELNPAYDQPGNIRPIWGLADPLPRTVRPGTKPSDQEVQSGRPREDVLQPTESQMEQGYGLRFDLKKMIKDIHDATRDREQKHTEKYGTNQRHQDSSEDDNEKEDEEVDDEDVEASHDQGEESHAPLNNIQEELHNHHTLWAVFRTKLREPLAEVLAVFVLMTIGICANVAHNLAQSGSSDSMAWSWGFGTMIGIYIAGGVSGAHLSPAITIMFYIFRGFPKKKIPVYIVAQLLGAYTGSLVAYGIYRNCILYYLDSHPEQMTQVYSSFVTNRIQGVADAASGFLTEFVATAFISIAVLATGDDINSPPGAGMNAFVLGLIVSVLTIAFSASTGAAINPARDLGPRLALITVGFNSHELFGDGWWVYGAWCAPITGAIVGAILYDVAIFVGGESPVNYPSQSVKRAGRKAKARWRHRFTSKER